jgi:hypothetical protein
MAKYKCHKCGVVDSLHAKNEGRSKLVAEVEKGFDEYPDDYYIYCRSCFYVNRYQPGWMGNLKFKLYLDGKEMFTKSEKMGSGFLFKDYNKINRAMIEDGIIPKGWVPKTIVQCPSCRKSHIVSIGSSIDTRCPDCS